MLGGFKVTIVGVKNSLNKFEKFFVIFTNADTFSVDKIHAIRACLKLMQEKPAVIFVSEVKAKNFKFDRQLPEYTIEGYDILPVN